MIILNFSHPLTPDQLQQVETLTGQEVERVIEINSHIDSQGDLLPQVAAMVDECGLSPAEWQTLPMLVNPPSLNFVAVVLLAELHGRCGYFPAHLRLRQVQGVVPSPYEVAEIPDLQTMRDAARKMR